MEAKMKPVWKHTHNGENGEELCECEGKYYTQFAWDRFLEAYTGRVRPAHRDRPRADFAIGPDGEITFVNYPPQYGVIDTSLIPPARTDSNPKVGVDSGISISNLWADDEITLEIP
jgi:hypothetical protein